MYQRSRKMLVFLLVIFLVIQVATSVFSVITNLSNSPSTYIVTNPLSHNSYLGGIWIYGLAWETIALCLAIWIAIRHFRELQRPSKGWAVGDCFTVLIQTHVFYFASFVSVSCLQVALTFSHLSVCLAVADICI